tara:strand:- start:2 stop:352 length:351 start_codon:yes stop_codon:yes gene_type:complete
MSHADDATKTWVSATPKKNGDGNVIEWRVEYKYTLAATGKDDFVHTFSKTEKIALDEEGKLVTEKTPDKYTKAELLTLMDKNHWDAMFNKKYGVYIADTPVETTDASFDVSTLSDS